MESVNRVLHPFGAAFLASYASISVSPKLRDQPAKSQMRLLCRKVCAAFVDGGSPLRWVAADG